VVVGSKPPAYLTSSSPGNHRRTPIDRHPEPARRLPRLRMTMRWGASCGGARAPPPIAIALRARVLRCAQNDMVGDDVVWDRSVPGFHCDRVHRRMNPATHPPPTVT